MDPLSIALLTALIGGIAAGGTGAAVNYATSPGKSKSKSPGGVTAGGIAPEGFSQFPRFSPEQQPLLNKTTSSALDQLTQKGGGLGDQNWQQYFNFAPIEQQARSQFQSQTIPSLAERFTAMGGQGGQRSSAFQGALGRSGADLESGLAALKAQYALPQAQLSQNQQGMNLNLLNLLLGHGLGQRTENNYVPPQPNAWSQAAGIGGQVAGTALPPLAYAASQYYANKWLNPTVPPANQPPPPAPVS